GTQYRQRDRQRDERPLELGHWRRLRRRRDLHRRCESRRRRSRRQCPSSSEEYTSELQSQSNIVCRLLLEKNKNVAAGALLVFLLYLRFLALVPASEVYETTLDVA